MLFLSFLLQAYEGMRLAQLGLESAATGLMLDACRATSMCNATHCMGIDDLSFGGTYRSVELESRLCCQSLVWSRPRSDPRTHGRHYNEPAVL